MPLVAGIPWPDAIEEPESELAVGALIGRGVFGTGNRVTAGGSSHFAEAALVAGAAVTAGGYKVGDPLPKPQIVVGPMRQAVLRSRWW